MPGPPVPIPLPSSLAVPATPTPSPGPGDPTGGGVAITPEQQFTGWVESAAQWTMNQLNLAVGNGGTTPGADWFTHLYAVMLGLSLLLIPFFVLLGLVTAWRRGAPELLWQTLGHVLLAVAIGQFAIWGVVALEGLADDVTGIALHDLIGNNLTGLLTHLGAVAAAGAAGTAFFGASELVGVIVIGLVLLGAVVILLELFMRMVGIYVGLAFIPIAAAGLTNPSTRAWMHRLAAIEIGLILLKPTIAILLGIGATMLSASPLSMGPQGDNGLVTMLGGLVVISLAALSPMALGKFAPWAEANITSAVTQHARTAAAIPLREGSSRVKSAAVLKAQKRFPALAAKVAKPTVVMEAGRVIVKRAGDAPGAAARAGEAAAASSRAAAAPRPISNVKVRPLARARSRPSRPPSAPPPPPRSKSA